VTANPHQPTLIIWDIDRTLVTIGEVAREIYESAFEEVIGQPLRELVEMAGRTEQAILVDTLRLSAIRHWAWRLLAKLASVPSVWQQTDTEAVIRALCPAALA
jgi:hypothetical protein